MIFNNKIERKLGLRYYNGGISQSSGNQKSQSTSQSGGQSTSTSAPQYTPEQLLSFYNTALPSMLSTANQGVQASPTAGALNAANKGAVEGVNAINMNGLTPGEANAIERSTNQSNFATGNLGNPNATTTIGNAMNFGGAFNNKIGLLNTATNTAAGVSGIGTNALAGTSSIFNPIASNATASNSLSNSMFGSQSASTSKGNNSSASMQNGLCYLTTACCKYKGLSDDCEELAVLRKFRDTFVPKCIVDDYYSLAPIIMPKVENSPSKLEWIYDIIKDCVYDIKLGKNESALNRYSSMVQELKEL
jgi:hypothetical protein